MDAVFWPELKNWVQAGSPTLWKCATRLMSPKDVLPGGFVYGFLAFASSFLNCPVSHSLVAASTEYYKLHYMTFQFPRRSKSGAMRSEEVKYF
jgi:hypothetical protein